MKAFFAFVLALGLSVTAFAAAAAPLNGNAATGGFQVFGTLADANNPVEMAVAPEYTRLAVVRSRTARWLKAMAASNAASADDMRVALFAAIAIQDLADNARNKLDVLVKTEKADMVFLVMLDDVRGLIKRAETLCDNAVKGN